MSFVHLRQPVSRRTLLRGALALPSLGIMSRGATKQPTRMVFVYVPNGIDMRYWTPEQAGTDFALPRILEPLHSSREHMLLLSGLTHNNGRALGDGAGDHARAAASYLTGVHPLKTSGADIRNGLSVDQAAARVIGKQTRFASLELGLEDGGMVGNCDSGYSCAYSNSIAWRNENSPLPPEISPRVLFERLFGSMQDGESSSARTRRLRNRRSLVDYALEDAKSLMNRVGTDDRRKLDEYLFAVRDLEKRLDGQPNAPQELDVPDGMPADFSEHCTLMMDLMTLAMQTDSTRVLTFMMGREGSTRTYREIGISDGHHPLTHHRNDPETMEKVARINCYHLQFFSNWVKKLAATPDGEGSLLDHSMIVYGSGISDGNRHTHHDLPVLLAGKGNGILRPGRHVRYAKETPMANLFVTMLDKMGLPGETLGDSNGRLDQLSDLS
jgi:hypothetical protein